MHGLDHSWSKLFILASHSMKSSCTSRLSLRNTAVLLQNCTPASAAMPRISLWRAPEVLTHHTTGDSAQNLPPRACFMKSVQTKLLLFIPARNKIALQGPHLLCITTSSLLLPYFPHPCQLWFFLPLIQDTVLQFQKGLCLGAAVMSVQAVNSLAHLQALPWAALRTTASPNTHTCHSLPSGLPWAMCPPWMFAVHGTQAIFLSAPLTLFLQHPTLTAFCPCASFSLQVAVMSLFLLYTMRTLFQQVLPILQKAAITQ